MFGQLTWLYPHKYDNLLPSIHRDKHTTLTIHFYRRRDNNDLGHTSPLPAPQQALSNSERQV